MLILSNRVRDVEMPNDDVTQLALICAGQMYAKTNQYLRIHNIISKRPRHLFLSF